MSILKVFRFSFQDKGQIFFHFCAVTSSFINGCIPETSYHLQNLITEQKLTNAKNVIICITPHTSSPHHIKYFEEPLT